MANVLIVDDEQGIRESLRLHAEDDGHRIFTAGSAEGAMDILHSNPVDVVLSDILMPNTSGVQLLQLIRENYPNIKVVLITGEPTVDTAIQATRQGAFDYLPKPVRATHVSKVVAAALRVKSLEDENRRYKEQLQDLVRLRTAALRESEERLRLAISGAQLGFWDWDIASGKVLYSQNWAGMLGYSLQDLEPNINSWENLVLKQDLVDVKQQLQQHLEKKTSFFQAEHRMCHRQGTPIWVLTRGKVFEHTEDGKPLRMVATQVDITHRKQAERQLQTDYEALKKALLSRELKNPEAFSSIVTNSPLMKVLFQYVESIAKTDRPVCITGETGVGKELMARAVHTVSQVKGELVVVNVASLDDNTFADTLFGHTKGAFTGAERYRDGLIKRAANGTLFLDEIGDLSPVNQVKLLRLVQENEYLPLGADIPHRSLARIVVATNRPLDELQASGQFRPDLYYRLKTLQVQIPPLRERLEDLPLLFDYFLQQASQSLDKTSPTPPKEIFDLLGSYSFPGNVRELESMVFDAVSHHKSKVLSTQRFQDYIKSATSSMTGQQPITAVDSQSYLSGVTTLPTAKELQWLLIQEAMKRANGNQTVAARMLGMSQPGLSKALKRQLEK